MIKGLFSQGVTVLFAASPEVEDLQALLADYDLFLRPEVAPWPMGSPGFAVDYDPEVNGKCIVEVCDRQWPDDMGHARKDQEMIGAWGFGFFGPGTQPGALGRAVVQCHAWPDAEDAVPRHRAFVRLLLGYALGGGAEGRLATGGDIDSIAEYSWLLGVARCVLDHPDAICLFNPAGEVLMTADVLDRFFVQWEESNLPPLEAAVSIRFREYDGAWTLSDTVGFSQFDVPDQQVAYQTGRYPPGEIAHFQLNVALYLFDHPDAIQTGNTCDGPGGLWRVEARDEALCEPTRRHLLHWTCDADPSPPEPLRRAERVDRPPKIHRGRSNPR